MTVRLDESKMYPIEADMADDVYELKDFQERVEEGEFLESDGSAYYSDGTRFMYEANYWNLALPPDWATHIVWHNK